MAENELGKMLLKAIVFEEEKYDSTECKRNEILYAKYNHALEVLRAKRDEGLIEFQALHPDICYKLHHIDVTWKTEWIETETEWIADMQFITMELDDAIHWVLTSEIYSQI